MKRVRKVARPSRPDKIIQETAGPFAAEAAPEAVGMVAAEDRPAPKAAGRVVRGAPAPFRPVDSRRRLAERIALQAPKAGRPPKAIPAKPKAEAPAIPPGYQMVPANFVCLPPEVYAKLAAGAGGGHGPVQVTVNPEAALGPCRVRVRVLETFYCGDARRQILAGSELDVYPGRGFVHEGSPFKAIRSLDAMVNAHADGGGGIFELLDVQGTPDDAADRFRAKLDGSAADEADAEEGRIENEERSAWGHAHQTKPAARPAGRKAVKMAPLGYVPDELPPDGSAAMKKLIHDGGTMGVGGGRSKARGPQNIPQQQIRPVRAITKGGPADEAAEFEGRVHR